MTHTTAITRITLTDFRSYAHVEVAAASGLVVVTGDNGQGKTNLLEAVSLLAPGRGLRGVALGEVARSGGAGGWTVAARVAAAGGDVDIGTAALAAAPDRRLVRINGAAAPLARLGEWLAMVWLTPAMDRLFSEPASGRRRFLDRLVLALEPGHARAAARYDTAMRERTRLLAEDRPDPAWLSALEAAMAEHGALVAAARARTVAALQVVLAAAPAGPFARADVAVSGGEAIDLAALLARARAADAAAGRATQGPHRSDFVVRHADKAVPAARASTGEQKALLLSIILAHAELVAARTGVPPVLLLDEVTAHLDAARRGALFERLAATRAQVWMTGTDTSLFAGADAATWLRIVGGQVEGRASGGQG